MNAANKQKSKEDLYVLVYFKSRPDIASQEFAAFKQGRLALTAAFERRNSVKVNLDIDTSKAHKALCISFDNLAAPTVKLDIRKFIDRFSALVASRMPANPVTQIVYSKDLL